MGENIFKVDANQYGVFHVPLSISVLEYVSTSSWGPLPYFPTNKKIGTSPRPGLLGILI